MPKAHRHHVASDWFAHGTRRYCFHRIRKPRGRAAGLSIWVEPEYRHLYPGGDRAGCCTEERIVVRIYGVIETTRDYQAVSRWLSIACCHTKAARRVDRVSVTPTEQEKAGRL